MQVMASQNADGEAVMQQMLYVAAKGKNVYSKQMGKFITCIQRKWLHEGVHVVCSHLQVPVFVCVRHSIQICSQA